MPETIANILQDCLDLIRRGIPVNRCLALYPEVAETLWSGMGSEDPKLVRFLEELRAILDHRQRD